MAQQQQKKYKDSLGGTLKGNSDKGDHIIDYIHMQLYVYTCMLSVDTCIYMNVYMNLCYDIWKYVYIFVYIYIHTYLHTFILTYIYTYTFSPPYHRGGGGVRSVP
jgi:hypothetical protein